MRSREASRSPDVRRDAIVEAATDVFVRYGRARTTMGDIADAAGISRPSLYLIFPRKDDVFAAVVRRMSDVALADLRGRLPRLRTLRARLLRICEDWGGARFDLLREYPDAADLFDLDVPAVRAIYEDFIAFVASVLADGATETVPQARYMEFARVLTYAMRGFLAFADDAAAMRRFIALEVDLIVAALEH